MAEIRHLENRHDVIFCWGWSDLDKISQNGAEWHVDCGDVVKIETRCRIPIWRTFGRIPWHVIPEPPATLQGVIIQSAILKTVFGHIFLFLFNAVWDSTSGDFRIVSDTLVTYTTAHRGARRQPPCVFPRRLSPWSDMVRSSIRFRIGWRWCGRNRKWK